MKLEPDTQHAQYRITAYDRNSISINRARYSHSLILSPDQIQLEWPINHWQDLKKHGWKHPILNNIELLIIGTGQHFKLIPPPFLETLYQHHIAVECMDTAAACRTFNTLSGDCRSLAAALIVNPPS